MASKGKSTLTLEQYTANISKFCQEMIKNREALTRDSAALEDLNKNANLPQMDVDEKTEGQVLDCRCLNLSFEKAEKEQTLNSMKDSIAKLTAEAEDKQKKINDAIATFTILRDNYAETDFQIAKTEAAVNQKQILCDRLIKMNLKELASLLIPNNEFFEFVSKINEKMMSESITANDIRIINYFVMNVVMFVVNASKLLELCLTHKYVLSSDKSRISTWDDMATYNIFLGTQVGVGVIKIALKIIYGDFFRIMRTLKIQLDDIEFPTDASELQKLTTLIGLLHARYLETESKKQ